VKRNLLFTAVVAAVLTWPVATPAQVVFLELTDASNDNVPLGNVVTIGPSDSFTYRAWFVADAVARSQIDGDGGLGFASIKITQSNASLVASSTPTPASPNPWPTANTTGSTTAIPNMTVSTFAATGIPSQSFGTNGQFGYVIGTFKFMAGSTPGSDVLTLQSMSGTVGDIGSFNGNFNYGSSAINRTTTFNISPVPEPPGLLALSGLASAGLAALWRRKASFATQCSAGDETRSGGRG
jgi:hypothetical protein